MGNTNVLEKENNNIVNVNNNVENIGRVKSMDLQDGEKARILLHI